MERLYYKEVKLLYLQVTWSIIRAVRFCKIAFLPLFRHEAQCFVQNVQVGLEGISLHLGYM